MDIDRLNTLREAQERFILDIEAKYSREAVNLQKRLLTALNEDLMSRLDITDGKIVNSQRNYNIIYEFDELWQNYSDSYFTPVIRNIATDALKVTALSEPYFKALGLSASGDVKLFAEATQNIESMMGIERKGKALSFTKGGYMDRLLLGADIKNDVMKVLTDNVSIGGGFKDLLVQMRETVTGSDQIDGTLQRYFRGYVYDTFSGVNAAYDNYVAGAAGMNYFVYEGTLIKTTRDFCKTHLGMVFHRKDLEKFDAMDWAGKNTGVPFIIGRGGYNCRHQLRWIPDEMVKDFKKGEFKSKGLTEEEKSAIRHYTSAGDGYIRINNELRHGGESNIIKKEVELIKSSIGKSDKYSGKLYRGSSISEKNYNNLLKQINDRYYIDKGFSSFSIEEKVANKFLYVYNKDRYVMFELDAVGKNGAFIGNKLESEVIFNPNTRFEVLEHKIIPGMRKVDPFSSTASFFDDVLPEAKDVLYIKIKEI